MIPDLDARNVLFVLPGRFYLGEKLYIQVSLELPGKTHKEIG